MRYDKIDGKWIPVNPDIKKVFMCTCHCVGLIVEKYDDEPEIMLYKMGETRVIGFKQKLKHIWKILTDQNYDYTLEEVILNKDTAVQLGKELFRIGSLPEKEKEVKTDVV